MIISSTYGRSTFRLFKRAQNDLDFLLRDIDRQPKVVEGDLYLIINDDYGQTILEKEMTVINETRAHYQVSITAEETLDLNPGLYSWCVKFVDSSDVERILYTNQDYTVRGVIEVSDGFVEPLDQPYTITSFTTSLGISATSAYPGAVKSHNNTGNHSIVVYMEDFVGTIFVDATVDNEIPVDDNDWQQVAQFVYEDASTDNDLLNFYGNFNYVRFRVSNTNGITKIVYRN